VASDVKAVTIRHVAAEAGVSLQTVSRVVNNGPNVTEAVRERVTAAIAKLGYVPNMAARRMGGSKSFLIIAFNDRKRTLEAWQAGRGSDWVAQMLLGAIPVCEQAGYHFLLELLDSDANDLSRQISAVISSLSPDGVILTPPFSQDGRILDQLTTLNVPFARIGACDDERGHRIVMDDREAAAVATRHLLALGHRRIGFIAGSPEYVISAGRLDGYRATMAEAGLTVAEGWVQQSDFGFESGLVAATSLLALDKRPSAAIASSDELALAVLHIASSSGLDVPDHLSLVSFDDTPPVRFSVPPLTAIRQPIAAMSAKAVGLLIEGHGRDTGYGPVQTLPFEFVIRESTGLAGEAG